ncbi:TFIIB-type zinc ribbon-containing protein [Schwartzia sp. (in: firmicutes)]
MAEKTVSYKCPNCSGPLEFQPGKETITCEYCGTELEVETVKKLFEKEQERAAQAEEAEKTKWDTKSAGSEWESGETDNFRKFTCSSCGAEIVSDENTMATECCYCGNPTMIPSRFDGMMRPDFIIPFKKTKQDAVNALKEFYKGKILLPGAFTENNRVEHIQAMYVPFWLFDSKVRMNASFKAEDDNIIDTPDAIITKTSVYDADREGTMAFEKVPHDGSRKLDDDYTQSIEPFDYSELVEFNAGYLAGYLADKYDVDADEAAKYTEERVGQTALDELQATVTGYTRVDCKSQSLYQEDSNVSYAMVPVWILTTRYEDKPYTFMMNGQTGKFVGRLPYSKTKAALYGAVPAIVSLPVFYYIAKWLLS